MYGFRIYIYVLDPLWVNFCMVWSRGSNFILLHMKIPVFPSPSIKESLLLPLNGLDTLLKMNWPYMKEFISGLSILFCLSICLPLCKDLVDLITIALLKVFKSVSVSPPTFLFLFKKLLWLFGVHYNSIWIWRLAFPFLFIFF